MLYNEILDNISHLYLILFNLIVPQRQSHHDNLNRILGNPRPLAERIDLHYFHRWTGLESHWETFDLSGERQIVEPNCHRSLLHSFT